jgi:DNA polymerase elongation subunit (family B)
MVPLEYGILIDRIDNKYWIQVNKTNVAIIIKEENTNLVKFFREGILIYEYRDISIDNQTFIRNLGNKQFIFKNNELVLLTIDKSTKFVKGLLPLQKITNKFLTFDIETLIKDNIHVPYCVCWFDGNNLNSYFINKFIDRKEIITQAIKDIMTKKYDNYKIYIHNLSGFDGIFLLKILAELGIVKPIIHNQKIISIKSTNTIRYMNIIFDKCFNIHSYYIIFLISYLFLMT